MCVDVLLVCVLGVMVLVVGMSVLCEWIVWCVLCWCDYV